MIQLLRKCLYIFQLKVIPQSVKNLVLCGYWNHITFLGSHTFNISDLTSFSVGLQNSWSNSLQLGEYDGDQDQEEVEAEVEVDQEDISLPQRITRSKFTELGSSGKMFSLFVVSFV